MAITLYAATIPTFLQVMGAVSRLVDRAETWCTEKGLAPAELLDAKLADDMYTFAYQVKSTAVHSMGAIEGLRRGVTGPEMLPPPDSFAGLRDRVRGAIAGLEGLDPAEINAFEGCDMRFEFGEIRIDFTAQDFLLSFSQPNFHFHATTAYDLLRLKGLAIGKRDYLGAMAIKGRTGP